MSTILHLKFIFMQSITYGILEKACSYFYYHVYRTENVNRPNIKFIKMVQKYFEPCCMVRDHLHGSVEI